MHTNCSAQKDTLHRLESPGPVPSLYSTSHSQSPFEFPERTHLKGPCVNYRLGSPGTALSCYSALLAEPPRLSGPCQGLRWHCSRSPTNLPQLGLGLLSALSSGSKALGPWPLDVVLQPLNVRDSRIRLCC